MYEESGNKIIEKMEPKEGLAVVVQINGKIQVSFFGNLFLLNDFLAFLLNI